MLRAVSTEQRERARQMMLAKNRVKRVKQNLMELCVCLWQNNDVAQFSKLEF